MYNGIGLNTPRGSGTNGYVVRNMSFVRPPRTDKMQDFNDLKAEKPTIRAPNRDILLHDRKRKVEVKCMELRIRLEDEGLSTDEIEDKVQELRDSLMTNFDEVQPRDAKSLQEHETHQLNAAKEEENKKMMRALRIDSSSYVEGAAFDPEIQEKRRQERLAKRQAAEESRLRNLEKRRRSERSPRPYRSRRNDRSRDKRRRTRKRSPTPSSSSGSDSEDDRDRRSRKHSSRRSRSYSRSSSVDSRERRSRRSRRRSPSPSVSRSPSRSPSRSLSRSPRRSRRRSPSYSGSEDERDRKYSSRRRRSPSSDSRSSSVESDRRRGRRYRSRSISPSVSRSVSRSASSDSRSSRD